VKYDELVEKYKNQLEKSLAHLNYSYNKVSSLKTDLQQLDDEQLEAWEGFMARFARTCDIFLSKYLRAIVSREDPGFRGTMRDCLNQSEKIGLIADANVWLEIRELRNVQAHEYTEEKLGSLFKAAFSQCHHLLNLKSIL